MLLTLHNVLLLDSIQSSKLVCSKSPNYVRFSDIITLVSGGAGSQAGDPGEP